MRSNELDKDCHIIATDREIEHFERNKSKIKQILQRAREREELMHVSGSPVFEFSTQEKKQIMVPLPNHDICNVCKVSYEDYHKHIASDAHKGNTKF